MDEADQLAQQLADMDNNGGGGANYWDDKPVPDPSFSNSVQWPG